MTSTAGSIASPAALGYLIEEVSPMWYAYILLGESIGVTFFFAIAVLLKKRLPQLQDQRQREITTVDLTESNPEQCVAMEPAVDVIINSDAILPVTNKKSSSVQVNSVGNNIDIANPVIAVETHTMT
jgi:hypothetical protein